MAIVVELKPEIEARLQAEAKARGVPVADFAGKLIENHASAMPFRTPEELENRLMSLAKECRALPVLDGHAVEEILGYGDLGLPYR